MYTIRRVPIDTAEKIPIDRALWGYDKYKPETYAQLSYDGMGFTVKFTVAESNPLRNKTKHLEFVHEDSCVEFFADFMPENSDKYINFETNANGAMNAAFRTDRYDPLLISAEEIQKFEITPVIADSRWTVTYKIGFDFIKSRYPDFNIKNCGYIKANFYKCGDKTEIEHYLSHFNVGCEAPDFHRPEYFGKLKIEQP